MKIKNNLSRKSLFVLFSLMLVLLLLSACNKSNKIGAEDRVSSNNQQDAKNKEEQKKEDEDKNEDKENKINEGKNKDTSLASAKFFSSPDEKRTLIPVKLQNMSDWNDIVLLNKKKFIDYINSNPKNTKFTLEEIENAMGEKIKNFYYGVKSYNEKNDVYVMKMDIKLDDNYSKSLDVLVNKEGKIISNIDVSKIKDSLSIQEYNNLYLSFNKNLEDGTNQCQILDKDANILEELGNILIDKFQYDVLCMKKDEENLYYDTNKLEFLHDLALPNFKPDNVYKLLSYENMDKLSEAGIIFEQSGDKFVFRSSYDSYKEIRLYAGHVMYSDSYIIGHASGDTSEKLSVYGEDLEAVSDGEYYSFAPMGDGYYLISKDFEDADNNRLNLSIYNKYAKCGLYKDGHEISGFDYFLLTYLSSDVFYIFDGKDFYFKNMKTNEKVLSNVKIKGEYTFEDCGGILIAKSKRGKSNIYITDKNSIEIFAYRELEKSKISTVLQSYGVNMEYKPVVELKSKNAEAESKINKDLASQYSKEFVDGDSQSKYYYDESGNFITMIIGSDYIASEYKDTLAFEIEDFFDTFGAHPMYWSRYRVYDLKSGKLLKYSDLFKDYETATDRITEHIYYISTTDDYYFKYISPIEEDPSDMTKLREYFLGEDNREYNYIFTDEGINIKFSPYALAAFSAGYIEYSIPYSVFEDYLKDEVKELLY